MPGHHIYLQALKAHSLSRHPVPIVRTLEFARKWVAAMPRSDLQRSEAALMRTKAFMDQQPQTIPVSGSKFRKPMSGAQLQ